MLVNVDVRSSQGCPMAVIEGRDVVSAINGFGAKLKRRRRAEGWTQEELGARAGTDQGTISAIEIGRSRPTMDTVRGLAKAFHLPVEELAVEAGYLDPETDPPGDVFDRTPLARIDALLGGRGQRLDLAELVGEAGEAGRDFLW